MSSKPPQIEIAPDVDEIADPTPINSTPLPQIFNDHPAYQRALEALLDADSLSEEQIQKLPQEAHGLSADRKNLIKTIKQSKSDDERISLLLDLRYRFGLPADLEILYFCLNLDQEHLTIDALNQLQHHLLRQHKLGQWSQHLQDRLRFLEVRSFNARIQNLAAICLNQLNSYTSD